MYSHSKILSCTSHSTRIYWSGFDRNFGLVRSMYICMYIMQIHHHLSDKWFILVKVIAFQKRVRLESLANLSCHVFMYICIQTACQLYPDVNQCSYIFTYMVWISLIALFIFSIDVGGSVTIRGGSFVLCTYVYFNETGAQDSKEIVEIHAGHWLYVHTC